MPWTLGEFIPGLPYVENATQLIDAPGHVGKIHIHGADCIGLAEQIINFLNATISAVGTISGG